MISPYFLPKFAAAPWLVEAPTTTTLVVVRRRELNTYLPATPSTRKCVGRVFLGGARRSVEASLCERALRTRTITTPG